MIQLSLIVHESNNFKLSHKLYTNDESTNLAIFFPGGGSSFERPILLYLMNYFIVNKFDILLLSYKNQIQSKDAPPITLTLLSEEIDKAIKSVYEKRNYKDEIFIAKSAGNSVSSHLKRTFSYSPVKSIYISPTYDAISYLEKDPGFIITAPNDEYLKEGDLDRLKKIEGGQLFLFEEGGHGLETDDVFETMDTHKKIITEVIKYVEN